MSSTTRVKFYFSYDGTHYSGWQTQKHTSHTLQQIVENTLARLASERVHVVASGRTDAGVHARIQVAHADLPTEFVDRMLEVPKSSKLIEQNKLILGLNALLPKKIRFWKCERVSKSFHAIREVQKKTYIYFIDQNVVQHPHLANYSWQLRFPLDIKAMKKAASYFVGQHNFEAFCSADSTAKSKVRTLYECRVEEVFFDGFSQTKLLAIRVTGSGFLKQMVRSITGTLVHIGNGKSEPELIRELLKGQETDKKGYIARRQKIGVTAPPHGLWLWDILY